MPIPAKHIAPFEPNGFYHVYNHAVGKDNLFYSPENYRYFLKKFDEYLSDWVEVYAWCLMPNHFHVLIRVREFAPTAAGTDAIAQSDGISSSHGEAIRSEQLIEQFRRFFIGYTQAINKQRNRMGTLFCKPFRRIRVDSEDYFTRLVYYIHANPVHHGFTRDLHDWEWSSYKRIVQQTPTKLQRQSVLDWFGGNDKYETFHLQMQAAKEYFKEFEP